MITLVSTLLGLGPTLMHRTVVKIWDSVKFLDLEEFDLKLSQNLRLGQILGLKRICSETSEN